MGAHFATTQWSQVLAARDGTDTRAREALEALCESYWLPLYAYVRRQGHDAEEARDLTQAYFAYLLEKGVLQAVDPAAGRFRSFLLSSLRHFLSHEWERFRAQKRGGGIPTLSLDTDVAEERYGYEPADRLTPEQLYERHWALTVLGRAMESLAEEWDGNDESWDFAQLKPYLTGERPHTPYRDLAAETGVTEGAVSKAVLRMRRRFGQLLRFEIAETMANAAGVDDEIRHLLLVIGPWEAAQS